MRRFLLIALLLVTACGFRPLHGTQYRSEQSFDLSSIIIEVDHTRRGQLLEAELRDNVNPDYRHGEKLFKLKITLKESDVPLFINPDGTSSRGDLQFTSGYKLTRILDGALVDEGRLTRTSSYNTSDVASQGYASYVSTEDAAKRGVVELAQDYKLRMGNLMAKYNAEVKEPQ